MTEIIFEILSSAILITGLVAVMMMLIECFNGWSKGQFSGKLTKSGPVQVVVAALLGAVPGCLGGFAVVSLYTHGMISFGALLAMMIAFSGDEAFYKSMLQEVTLPGSLKAIGARAFYGTPIVGIVIPECVETIGESAFYACWRRPSRLETRLSMNVRKPPGSNCPII